MGISFRSIVVFTLAAVSLCLGTSCQPTVSSVRLIQHQALIDCSGLGDVEKVESVKANVAAPQKWLALLPKHTPIYTDMQWRSPSKIVGLGVAYVHLPFPVPASMIVWLAKQEYGKRGEQGELLGEWTDQLGRPWFEAQNIKYHVRGYVITRGFDAWIIYCGYKRTDQPPSSAELGVASRALERVVPTPIAPDIPDKPMASVSQKHAGAF